LKGHDRLTPDVLAVHQAQRRGAPERAVRSLARFSSGLNAMELNRSIPGLAVSANEGAVRAIGERARAIGGTSIT
jgi:hypothetical protein